ncbi:MAG: phosphotransferase [Eubacteriales bacterium]
MDKIYALLSANMGFLPEDIEVAESFVGGLTNKSVVFTHKGRKYFLRLGTPQSGLLGINRRAEYAALLAVSDTLSEILYFNPDNGDMVMDFIEGTVLSASDLSQHRWIDKTVDLFKDIHSRRAEYDFDPFGDIASRFTYCREHGVPLPRELDGVLDTCHAVQERLCPVPDHFYGLCHNDPFEGNFIWGRDERLRLIDYEYAGNGDIFFDLACLAWGYSPELRAYLLEKYFGQCTDELYGRLYDNIFVVSLWNASWAAVKSEAQTPEDRMDYREGLFRNVSGLVNWYGKQIP